MNRNYCFNQDQLCDEERCYCPKDEMITQRKPYELIIATIALFAILLLALIY